MNRRVITAFASVGVLVWAVRNPSNANWGVAILTIFVFNVISSIVGKWKRSSGLIEPITPTQNRLLDLLWIVAIGSAAYWYYKDIFLKQ
jgi:hypothetical protein